MPVEEGDRDNGSGDRTESGSAVTKVRRGVHILTLLSSFIALRIEPNFGNETRPEENVAGDGQLIEPSRTKEAFSAQSGVLVRDMIPISIH